MSLSELLAGLTRQEKLEAMEILWWDLSANPESVPSPDWHGELLSERMNNPSGGKSLPLDAAFAEIRERLNERRAQE